jgi:hypothetical protein
MAAPLCAEPSDGFVAWVKISGCSTGDRTKLIMKKLLTVVPMAMGFTAAGAISSFCANVAGEVSDVWPVAVGRRSFAREPLLEILAQAGSAASRRKTRSPRFSPRVRRSRNLARCAGIDPNRRFLRWESWGA